MRITDNLFLALQPEATVAARIHRLALGLRELYGLKGKPQPVELLHVTVCFLGGYPALPPELLASAVRVAEKAVRGAPIELTFDRVMSFKGGRKDAPLVLCRDDDCAPLTRLHGNLLLQANRAGGFFPGAGGFKPHVTLLRDARMISLQEVAAFSWTATEVLLIRSLVGQGRYEVLRRYPLH